MLKFIRIGALILVIVLPLFYMLLGVIGQTTQNSFANYITFYLGSPIPCFDEYLENSYKKVDLDIEKIFEKGYSTKKEEKDNHGLGLWTVRKILNQTDNLSLFTKAGELFSQQLEIYEQKVNI